MGRKKKGDCLKKRSPFKYFFTAMAIETMMNVRCCGIGQNGEFECVTPEKKVKGSCPKREAKSYGDARKICKKLGKDLCTKEQLENGLCCGTGCGFDLKGIWIKDGT